MRIAIIGAGNVGGALGTAFSHAGHEVVFGVREPVSERTRAALASAEGASIASPAAAVEAADVICFALRWDAVPEIVGQLPPLAGRIVIDAMNRLAGDPTRSTTQDLADLLPGARLAKAFNTIGFENLTTAHERQKKAAMFVAGDDAEAKSVATRLAAQASSPRTPARSRTRRHSRRWSRYGWRSLRLDRDASALPSWRTDSAEDLHHVAVLDGMFPSHPLPVEAG
jgi:8-hydroxy-5-deazaflavin:NADPH oxidoreductase